MKRIIVLLFGILLLFCVSTSFAQTYYLKVGDIVGESTERAHKDWIICESFSQGIEQAQSASGAARQRGSVVLNDLIIIKKLDKTTPKLMEICTKGRIIPQMELHMVANGNVKYKLTLNNVKITSINTSTICEPDCKLVDEVAFSYSQITWLYLDSTGNEITASYNAQTGN